MPPQVDSIMQKIRALLWPGSSDSLPAWVLRPARMLYVLIRDLLGEELTLRATSLVYTTLLSLVPLLALSFSVLKGFGVHNQLEPVLLNLLAPLGPKGAELTGRLLTFVDNVKVGVLGSVGLAFLVLTVLSLIQKVERAFNSIWRVSSARGIARRFSDYLSVVLIGPVLVFTALGATGSVMSSDLTRLILTRTDTLFLLNWIGYLIPIALLAAVFSFIYIFLPNTRVRFGPALGGGFTAALLWEFLSRIFATFIAGSTNYTAIYSGFAILIIFMLWMYMSWLVVLLGGSVAFYLQHPEELGPFRYAPSPGPERIERLTLECARAVAVRFQSGMPPMDLTTLTDELNVTQDVLEPILDTLCAGGILNRVCTEMPAFMPARPLETILVGAIIDTARTHGRSPAPSISAQTDRIMNLWSDGGRKSLDNLTLADFIANGQ